MQNHPNPEERSNYAAKVQAMLAALFPQGTEIEWQVSGGNITLRVDERRPRRVIIKISEIALDDYLMHPEVNVLATQKLLAYFKYNLSHIPERYEEWDVTAETVRI